MQQAKSLRIQQKVEKAKARVKARCLMKRLRMEILEKESMMTEKTESVSEASMKMTRT